MSLQIHYLYRRKEGDSASHSNKAWWMQCKYRGQYPDKLILISFLYKKFVDLSGRYV